MPRTPARSCKQAQKTDARVARRLPKIDPVPFARRVAFSIVSPPTMNDEALAEAAAASPFRLPDLAMAQVRWRRLDDAHHPPLARADYSFTGVRTGAPLAFSSTTTNLAGSVLLALRPTT